MVSGSRRDGVARRPTSRVLAAVVADCTLTTPDDPHDPDDPSERQHVLSELMTTLTAKGSDVAPRLLGWTLSHTTEEGTVSVLLTEVEAYDGADDPASHAFRGPSPRNDVMFGPAGRLYTYFTYGMHWCCNVVTGPVGQASAVLLRAGRVTEGVDLARARRGERVPDRSLARGPACLAQALAVGKEQNGADLLGDGALRLSPGPSIDADRISAGPRVGISVAADVPWRYWVTGDPSVSAYKRSPRAR